MGLAQNIVQKIVALFKSTFQSDSVAQKSLLQVTDLPSWQQLLDRDKDFPNHYSRYFQPDPLPDSTGLQGRDEELATLNELLERWISGHSCSVAVIGPEGSGKTSLLNGFLASAQTRCPVLGTRLQHRIACVKDLLAVFADSFGLDAPFQTVPDAIRFILSRPRQVFALEHGHNLTLRLVGCREALEAFFHILLETRQHWLWVVSFRQFPWDRLGMTDRIQQYFTHQLSTLYQDGQQVREIIEGRHAQTGLSLEFIAEEGKDRTHDELGRAFYAELFAATGGNVVAAFYYWLLCLDDGSSGETIRVKPLGKVEADYLRSIERRYHFSLAEVIWHGGLSCSEHQRIFLLSKEASRLQLEYLVKLNLLVADGLDEDGYSMHYRLNPVYYQQVVSLLESLHLIY